VSAGRALPGVELRIGSDQRIRVRGETLASSLLDEPLPLDDEGWLVTDDLGRLDADGELFVHGRASDRLVSGGENVDPLFVEACLLRDAHVAAACVFGIPDPRFGELVVCALVVRPGFDAERLQALLSKELPPWARPRRAALLGELPLTASGKLHRPRVRALAAARLLPWAELKLAGEGTPI
jgi:acyl-CoA synthetase (AMP-forming)/AMP-acid ligase II